MSFQEFESMEDAFAFMDEQTVKANSVLSDEQKAVTWGSYWVRFYDIGNRVVIFGKVLTKEEFLLGESKGLDRIADEEEREEVMAEIEWSVKRREESHERGYLFGWAYSILEPDGEPGDTHRANLWPIQRTVFINAQEWGWRIDEMHPDAKALLENAYNQWQDWAIRTQGQW